MRSADCPTDWDAGSKRWANGLHFHCAGEETLPERRHCSSAWPSEDKHTARCQTPATQQPVLHSVEHSGSPSFDRLSVDHCSSVPWVLCSGDSEWWAAGGVIETATSWWGKSCPWPPPRYCTSAGSPVPGCLWWKMYERKQSHAVRLQRRLAPHDLDKPGGADFTYTVLSTINYLLIASKIIHLYLHNVCVQILCIYEYKKYLKYKTKNIYMSNLY